jgi:hypothetical protein
MSIIEERPVVAQPGEPGSLRDVLSKRRKQLQEKRGRVITLPVDGYEDLLAGSYRRLEAEEYGDLVAGRTLEDPHQSVEYAADVILRANVDLLRPVGTDPNGKPKYQSLGARWTPGWIRENFDVDLPDGVMAREALFAALDSTDILSHFRAYRDAAEELERADAEDLPGESVPSAEG